MSQMHPGNLLGRDSRQLDAWEEEIDAALSKLPQHALQSFWNLAVACLVCDSGVCHRLAYLANTLVGRYLPNNVYHTTRACVSQWVTTTKNASFFNQSWFHKSYLMLNSLLFFWWNLSLWAVKTTTLLPYQSICILERFDGRGLPHIWEICCWHRADKWTANWDPRRWYGRCLSNGFPLQSQLQQQRPCLNDRRKPRP